MYRLKKIGCCLTASLLLTSSVTFASENVIKEPIELTSNYALEKFEIPNRFITYEESSAFIPKSEYGNQSAQGLFFSDVNENDWYYKNIKSMFDLGIINGFDDGNFYPNDPITREEAINLTYSSIKVFKESDYLKESSNHKVFLDDEVISEYSREAINSLHYNEIISGFPDNFIKPKELLSRGDSAHILRGITTLTDENVMSTNFLDISDGDYFFKSITSLEKAGLIQGKSDNKFFPLENITRAEFATLLNRCLNPK